MDFINNTLFFQITINSAYILLMGTLAYLIGTYFNNLQFKRFKKHFIENASILTVILSILAFFLPTTPPNDYSNLQQALFTFASVFFGFWLSDERKKEELKVQKMKELDTVRTYFFLIWEELRFNINQIEYMKLNIQTGFSIDHEGLIEAALNKLNIFEEISHNLKNNIYHAYISSNTFVNLTTELLGSSDQRFQLIGILDNAYTEGNNLKSFLMQTTLGIRSNLLSKELIKRHFPTAPIDDSSMNEEIKIKIEDAIKEILICYRNFEKCINELESYAPKLDIKLEEDFEREDYLLPDDKKTIQNLFNPPPDEALSDPFNYSRKKAQTENTNS